MASNDPLNQPTLKPPSDVNPRDDVPLDFPDREYGKLTADDYGVLGFMSGLEVHQQLITRTKLFCRCPAGHYVDHFDAEVLRHMRPTLSELGEYDGTALMEFKTRKEIVYQLERGTVCTYEIDDTPPFEIDEEAIKVALEICQLFDLDLVSELHVMRKQYLDGSIPTGFQRTAMMGLGGSVPFVVPELGIERDLNIRQLSLEEDSCREISDIGHRITFRTDRLGMPLTEVVTEPELLTPLELQAAGRLIARVTRTSGKVRRGPGAARQDVNVSVAGGRRVEIKGVSHHRGLPQLVHLEGYRQLNLLRVREQLRHRGVTPKMLLLPEKGVSLEESPLVVDATSTLRRSDYAPLRDCLDRGEMAAALKLPGFGGLLTHRTQPGITFANEFADRVRVIACLTSRPFMIHSDIEGYGLGHNEWRHLRTALKAGGDDSIVVLWGPALDVETGAREVFLRAIEALEGIPAETRQAFADGTTGFERILPGADRMYPDTDTPPLPVPDAWVDEIRTQRPERPWERQARYEKLGLAPNAAAELAAAPWADLFDELVGHDATVGRRIAGAMAKRIPYWWRRERRRRRQPELRGELPSAARLAPLALALASGKVRAEATDRILDLLIAEPSLSPEEIVARFTPRSSDEGDMQARIDHARKGAARLHHENEDSVLRWAMGQVMPPMIGRVDPGEVRDRLRHALLGAFENRTPAPPGSSDSRGGAA